MYNIYIKKINHILYPTPHCVFVAQLVVMYMYIKGCVKLGSTDATMQGGGREGVVVQCVSH